MTSRLEGAAEPDFDNLPCPAHIAFAFVMVRSKPPQVSIEDHLASLREAITRRPQASSISILGFDAGIYWRNSYQKSESERLILLNEVSQLKQERDTLKVRGDLERPNSQPSLGKRKRTPTAANSNKNPARGKIQDARPALSDDDLDLDLENLNSVIPDNQVFLHGFISLRRNLRLEEPDQPSLVTAIRIISRSFTKIIHLATPKMQKHRAKQEGRCIIELCTVIRTVYPFILRGLETISPEKGDDGEQYFPGVIDVVRLLEAFLGRLHKFALDEFVRRQHAMRSRKKSRGLRGEAASNKISDIPDEDLDKAKEITKILAKMVTMLDVSVESHCDLLRGFLCTLLDHIGSSLSLLVFTDPQQTGDKQPGILPPAGLLDVAHLDSQAAIGTVQIEGPFVIFVLRTAVEYLRANTKRMSERSLSNFSLRKSGTRDEKEIHRLIEETLQNTLLRGAFGDDDETFYSSLRREDGDDEDNDLAKMVEDMKEGEDSTDWFIGQLWEHLGWDILSGKRGV